MRRSLHVAVVLRELLKQPDVARFGSEFAEACNIFTGTLYPMLRRLRDAGFLEDLPEEVDPSVVERPARRYFRLTAEGEQFAREYVAAYKPPRLLTED